MLSVMFSCDGDSERSGEGPPRGEGGSGAEDDACFELDEDAVSIALTEMNDDHSSLCFEGDGPDARFVWTAPQTGRYLVQAAGGERKAGMLPVVMPGETSSLEYSIPPSFMVRAASCDSPAEQVCSRLVEVGDMFESLHRTVVALEAGEPMTVMVQVNESTIPPPKDDNQYVALLTIDSVTCGEEDLGSMTEVHVTHSVDGVGTTFGPVSCLDTNNAPSEKSYRFVAAEAGTYVATLTDKYGEFVALARYSSDCMQELSCVTADGDAEARLSMDLEVGEEVILVGSAPNYVDEGYTFVLDIQLSP